MNLTWSLMLIGLALSPLHSRELNDLQTLAVLSCIQQKGQEVGAPIPVFDSENIRFRYHAGQFPFRYPTGEVVQVDRENEVRIAVYGPQENSFTIYDVFLTEIDGKLEIQIGHPSSYSKHNGKLAAGDNPGGQATDLYLRQLVKRFSVQKPLMLSMRVLSTSLQGCSCVR
jgi:hypothetical protein